MNEGPRVIGYGGGVQSTALLVLAAQGRITYRTATFCNVGEDSEAPATLRYVREVAQPFAQAHGIVLHELVRQRRDGSTDSILSRLGRDTRSIGIPMRLENGAPCNRSCTGDFKIKVTARWLRAQGATAQQPGTVALGISVDEMARARTDSGFAYQRLDYPLLTLRLDRLDCRRRRRRRLACASEVILLVLPIAGSEPLAKHARARSSTLRSGHGARG